MKTEAEIRTNYKELHDLLSESYYNFHNISKEEFDLQHGEIWNGMEAELIAGGYLKAPEPPVSTHISVIDAIDTNKPRPVRIKRIWEGRDYFYDCFVTESVKDQYMAGSIVAGDYVVVHFDDRGEQLVMEKVFKSW